MPAISALAAARHMCQRSDWTLTNLELQKMLYLAQMMHLGLTGERLLNSNFEAWDYGPVIPVVYSQAKTFGSGPIRNVFFGVGDASRDAARANLLNDAYDQLSRKTAGELVNITHWSGGAWARNYRPGVKGIVIPDLHIVDEYRARTQQA